VAQRSESQVGESSMRRSCRLSGGSSGIHMSPTLAHHDKPTRGRAVRQSSIWVRPNRGLADLQVALFALVFVQVTARWVPSSVWGCLRGS
jgi:hypothetical protein